VKTVYATIMLISLFVLAVMSFLAIAGHFQGQGLHPAVAACGGLFAALVGWRAAGRLADAEQRET
jgi:hypothetical protein